MTAKLSRISPRVFLATIAAPNQTGEAEQFQAQLRSYIAEAGRPCIVIADCSQASVLLPHVRAAYLQVMDAFDDHIAAAAFLIPTIGPFGDQIVKLVERSSDGEAWRVFTEKRSLVRWMCDMLSAPEQVALKQAVDLPDGALTAR